MLVMAMVGIAANASAQEKSRVEVAQQVAHQKQQTGSSEGSAMSGSSDSGRLHQSMDACVGPAGFCTPYFGS